MKNEKYQSRMLEDCLFLSSQLNKMIDGYFPKDIFCSTKRETLIRDIESNIFIKNSPSIVCIVEYSTKNYVYISENIKGELNISASELLEMGMARALLNFEENQKQLALSEIYPSIFEYYLKYASTDQAKNLHVTYNTLLKAANGEYKWYYHQLAVIACDERGFPRYALKLLSCIDHYKKDDVLNFNISLKHTSGNQEVVLSKDYSRYEVDRRFSSREKEIMKLVADGYSTKEISEKLFISANTVSTHRKNSLKKLKNENVDLNGR